jgi:hypothetical protein
MALEGVTSNSELIEELRKRCGFGPSILKAQAGTSYRRPTQSPLKVSLEAEDGALTLDQYMAR